MVNEEEIIRELAKAVNGNDGWCVDCGEKLEKGEYMCDGCKEFYIKVIELTEEQAKKETAQELLKRIIELNDEQNVFNGQYILTAEDVQDVIRFYLRELKHIGEYKIEAK